MAQTAYGTIHGKKKYAVLMQIHELHFEITCILKLTLIKASMSPTAGMKSGMNGFNLCSRSIVCGVYLKPKRI